MIFDIHSKVISYPLIPSLVFSTIISLLSSCSNGKEQPNAIAVGQSIEIPTDNISESTINQKDSFLWNGEFTVNRVAPSKSLDTTTFNSQLFDISGNTCRVYISLSENDRDEADIYFYAIERASACPLCKLESVYDISVQDRKGIGTLSSFTDIRQPGTWKTINNTIWFNKSETTFNKFAHISFDCWVGAMEFVNLK